MNLRTKLLIPLTLIVSIPVIIFGIYAYGYLLSSTQTTLVLSVKEFLESVSPKININIRELEKNIKELTSSNNLHNYLDEGESRQSIAQYVFLQNLATYRNRNPNFKRISLFLGNGKLDSYVSENKDDFFYKVFEDAFLVDKIKNSSDSEIIYQFERQEASSEYTMIMVQKLTLSNELYSNNQVVNSVFIKAELNVSEVLGNLASAEHIEGLSVFLIDNESQVLMSTNNFSQNNTFADIDFNDFNSKQSVSINEIDYQIVTLDMEAGLSIVALIPEGLHNESANQLILKTFLFVGVAALLIILFSFAYINSILLKPIIAMKQLVTDITLGKMDSRFQNKQRSDEVGTLSSSILKMRDQIKQSTESIKELAYFDSLTKLPNRQYFQKLLESTVSHSEKNELSFALSFLDLDNFKRVNDTLGHDIGDKLLIAATKRICTTLSIETINVKELDKLDFTKTIVSRLGGDEFVLLIKEYPNKEVLIEQLTLLTEALSTCFSIEGSEVNIGASIGVAIYPEHGKTSSELLKSADLAMYNAKSRGKNNVAMFDEKLCNVVIDSQKIGKLLNRALLKQEFKLEYQPRICLRNYKVTSLEALVRWNCPELGDVNPSTFISVAEETKQITKLGAWIIDNVVNQLHAWQKDKLTDFSISINVSYLQLFDTTIVDDIEHLLGQYKIAGQRIEIEITESLLAKAESEIIGTLNALRAMGIKIALDNFGFGDSSLMNLKRLPIDIIKIDSFFLQNVLENKESGVLFNAIVQLAKELGIKTIAKGVETSSMHDFILLSGCDEAQGFYYSRTMDTISTRLFLQNMQEKHSLKHIIE